MGKKFYLQDAELQDPGEDFFRHRDLAINIENILRENEAPYNIAIIGKWGLGKSSLINLALAGFKNEPDKYLLTNINAWKYEKEVLSKVFLRQVMEKLEGDNETTQSRERRNIFESIKRFFKPSTFDGGGLLDYIKKGFRKYKLLLFLYVIVTMVAYLAYYWLNGYVASHQGQTGFTLWIATFLAGYLRNSVTLVLVPAVLVFLTQIIQNIKENPLRRVGFQLPEMNVEDYENELGHAIERRRKEKGDFKIIVTLDDLDRLSPEKMVEALDAIKMFINFENCIFLVPFDDTILKKAIFEERLNGMSDGDVHESEYLLDKLFQYRIYLLPPLAFDIKKYAKTLCEDNLQDFFVNYCNQAIFMRVIDRVLIYAEVSTPRQVKKLVNNFVSYMMLASKREKEGKAPVGFATTEEGIFSIAKMSVLQADFNEFYDLLFDEPDAIENLLAYQRYIEQSQRKDIDEDDEAKVELSDRVKSFIGTDSKGNIPLSATPLLSFLNYTKSFGKDNLLPYLYVTEDDISLQTGSKEQREFIKAASSNNIPECSRLLSENPKLALAAINYIRTGNDDVAVSGIVEVLVAMWDSISEEYMIPIADAISERAEDILACWEDYGMPQVEAEGLLDYYDYTESKEGIEKLLCAYVSVDPGENARDVMTAYFSHRNVLPQGVIRLLHIYTKKAIESTAIDYSTFIGIRRGYDLTVNDTWRNIYYRALIAGINDNEDNSSEAYEELRKVYDLEKEDGVDAAFKQLELLFDKPWACDILAEFVKKDAEVISNDYICDLIVKQISADMRNDEEINKLLTSYEYELSDEEGLLLLDNYFVDQLEKEEIIDVLRVYLKNNTIGSITNAATEIINSAFTSDDNNMRECTKMIIAEEEEATLKQVLTNLNVYAIHTSSKYNGVAELLKAYADVKSGDAVTLINTNITAMSNTIKDDFIKFMTGFLSKEVDNDGFSSLIQSYIKAVIAKIKKNENISEAMEALIELADVVADVDFVGVEPQLYKLSSDKQYISKLYRLYEKKWDAFGKEEGKADLSNFVDICLKAIRDTNLKDEAVQSLGNKFENISKVVDLYKLADLEGIDKVQTYAVCRKFLKNKIYGDKKVIAVQDICGIIEKGGYDAIDEVMANDKADVLSECVSCILQSADKFSYTQTNDITGWAVNNNRIKGVSDYIDELISLLVTQVGSGEDADAIIDYIQDVPTRAFNGKREKYISIFVELLKKGYGEQLNERLIQMAKERGISDKVIGQAPDSMSKELKSYLKK